MNIRSAFLISATFIALFSSSCSQSIKQGAKQGAAVGSFLGFGTPSPIGLGAGVIIGGTVGAGAGAIIGATQKKGTKRKKRESKGEPVDSREEAGAE